MAGGRNVGVAEKWVWDVIHLVAEHVWRQVVGLISAIVGIIETITTVYKDIKNAEHLPQAFREVAERLPLVRDTLQTVEKNIGANTDEEACEAMKTVVERCKVGAGRLEEIFKAVAPLEGTSRFERYRAAVRRLGKGNRVEVLTKEMMGDVRLLAANRAVQAATQAQVAQLHQAIEYLADMEPSLSDEESTVSQTHCGTGDNVAGDKYNGNHNVFSGCGTANFGPVTNHVSLEAVLHEDFLEAVKRIPREECSKSLSFPQMNDRINDIGHATEGTCRWISRHQTYTAWVSQPQSLLKIEGKLGSGKSTLIRYALEQIKATRSSGKEAVILSFFFHGRGSELQKTRLGLFRSLLHQLLSNPSVELPDLVATFQQRRETMGKPGEAWHWHVEELQCWFESSLLKVLETWSVWLFVDASNECAEELKLAETFRSLLERARSTGLKQLRICFARRWHPVLKLAEKSTILLNNEIAQDIATFVNTHFSTENSYPEVVKLITKNSQGVFLWACLASKKVKQMIEEGKSLAKITGELKQVPDDFNRLYRDIMEDFKSDSAEVRLMRWISFSVRPLTTNEIRWAMAVNPNNTNESLSECERSEDFITPDRVESRIKALSCGLAEIISAGNARRIHFIHSSVKDFLEKGGLLALCNTTKPAEPVVPAAHCLLSRCCVHYFQMAMASTSILLNKEYKSRYPLLHYATTSWFVHAQLGDDAKASTGDLLRLLKRLPNFIELWVTVYQRMEPFACDCPTNGSNLIHVASRYGLTTLLSCLIVDADVIGRVDINARDGNGQTPLSWAARNGHTEAVKLLLGADEGSIDERDTDGQTPLSWAARNGHEAVVELLLRTDKVSINKRDKNGQTPLSWAARNGHEAAAELLIKKDEIDVDVRDNFNWTPLLLATESGHDKMVQLLLETEDVDINARDTVYGQTPLYRAAGNGHSAVVEQLLNTNKVDLDARDAVSKLQFKQEINLEAKDHYGNTSLLRAALNGHKAVARLLIEKGADLKAKNCKGNTPLSLAALNGHKPVVRLLLEEGADPEAKDSEGITPLLWAAYTGHEPVARLLLEKGADIEAKSHQGNTPLSWAAGKGHEPVARLLLEKGANLEAKDGKGVTPLLWAVHNRHERVTRLLLDKGADLKAKNSAGITPLSTAALNGHEPMARLLLEKGADIEAKSHQGNTPLSWAAGKGHEPVARLLLEKGADIEAKDGEGITPLSTAASNGHEPVTRLLLEKGADLMAKNSEGVTPLLLAAHNGYKPVTTLLLERGADLESKSSNNKTPLSIAAFHGHEPVIRLLLERGADIEAKDSEGVTPLLWAAGKGHEPVARLLLEKGADLEAKDRAGITPLSIAALHGHKPVVRLLLERGASLEAKHSDSITLLSWAVHNGHELMARLLLEKGADIEAKDGEGITPLSTAVLNGHEPVARLLLEKGADIEAKSHQGNTPLSWAAGKGHETVTRLLLEKGADLEAKNRKWNTPLSLAALNGHETVAGLLLEKGADLEAKNRKGNTPLLLAAKRRHRAIERLLLDKGAVKRD